ncbi:DnaJ (Hsp40), subfamily C, member 2 [Balamuthia mandrillaris]
MLQHVERMTWQFWRPALCLEAPPSAFDGRRTVVSPLSGWGPFKLGIYQLRMDPAGLEFEKRLYRSMFPHLAEPDGEEQEGSASSSTATGGAQQEEDKEDAKFRNAKKKKLQQVTEDYYEILGIAHRGYLATAEEIKKAYRKSVLAHHPDKKVGSGEPDAEDDTMFKAITKAYETLSDPNKRRAYDSQNVTFDDTIPTAANTPHFNTADFYDLFGPVFARNSRWASDGNAPQLGDDKTPFEKVEAFYEYWFHFNSWRDFSYLDEYDPNDAESREEKRWMERQNLKERTKRKKQEVVRINTLVETAYKRDPRVKRQKEELKEKKRREREARHEAARRQAEEEARKAREEQERKEREEKAKAEEAAAERKRTAKALRKYRTNLRKLVKSAGFSFEENDLEALCSRLSLPRLRSLCTAMAINDASSSEQAAAAEAAYREEVRLLERETEQQEQQQQKSATPPWTEEELSLLAQGSAKFPGATSNRWRLITQFINEKSGSKYKRAVKEVIMKTAQLKEATDVATLASAVGPAGSASPSVAPLADMNGNISVRWDAPIPAASASGSAASVAPSPSSKAAASPAAASPAQTKAPAAASASPATAAAATTAKKEKESVWSQEQQKALEEALKVHPVSEGKQRWDNIAAAVPGKSKKECVERFKYLVNFYKQGNTKKTSA